MTDVSKLSQLAGLISTASPAIRKYAVAQAAVSVSQENAIRGLEAEVLKLKGSGTTSPGGVGGVPPPPVTPNPLFGTLLPTRLIESGGAVINVSTVAALANALTTAAVGSTINITANLTSTTKEHILILRNATAAAPITVTANAGVLIKNFGEWDVRGSYLRFRGLEFYNDNTPDPLGAGDGTIDFSSGAHHCEIDRCTIHGLAAGSNLANGLYFGSGCGDNIQVWNSKIYFVGRANGLDHGIYWSTSPSNGVIANCLIYQPYSYGIQVYPNVQGMIVTCCTIDGGQTGMADPRGGIVIGDEDAVSTRNLTLVGMLVTNAPGISDYAIHANNGGVNNRMFDSLAFGNTAGPGDFGSSGSGAARTILYTNCTHADPLYVNRTNADYRLQSGSPAIGKIQSGRYGYVPQYDIDGNIRVTADAGCYRA